MILNLYYYNKCYVMVKYLAKLSHVKFNNRRCAKYTCGKMVPRQNVESLRLLLHICYQKKLLNSENNWTDFKQNLEVM